LYEDASDVPPPKSGFEDLFIKCGRDVDTFFKVYFHPFNPVVQSYLEDEEKSGFAEFVKGVSPMTIKALMCSSMKTAKILLYIISTRHCAL